MATRVELLLLGQRLTVRTEAPAEHVQRLAAFLEARVNELKDAGVRDPMTALTLAALDIADELFRAREDRSRETEVRARLGALVALLDEVAPPGGEP